MEKILCLTLFVFIFLNSNSQDRIVCINQDTIHCTILSVGKDRIMYELHSQDGSLLGMSIPLSRVESYSRSSLKQKKTSESHLKAFDVAVTRNRQLWRVGLDVGGSFMPQYYENLRSLFDLQQYCSNLKSGYHISANGHYMVREVWGVGVEYSFFQSEASGRVPILLNAPIFVNVSETYRQYINYLGPSVVFQHDIDTQHQFIFRESISTGVMFFRLENQVTYPYSDGVIYNDLVNNMLLTGSSFAVDFSFSAEYRLSPVWSVGLGGSFIVSSLKKVDYEAKNSNSQYSSVKDQELSKALNLSRFDYSFVVRCQF